MGTTLPVTSSTTAPDVKNLTNYVKNARSSSPTVWVKLAEAIESITGHLRNNPVSGSVDVPYGTPVVIDQEVLLTGTPTIITPAAPPQIGSILLVAVSQDGTGGRQIAWAGPIGGPTAVNPNPGATTFFLFIGRSDLVDQIFWSFITSHGSLLDNPIQIISTLSDSAPINNTAALTPFNKTINLPVGSLDAVGVVLRVRGSGKISTANPPPAPISIQFQMGGYVFGYFQFQPTLQVTNQAWSMEADMVIRSTGPTGAIKGGYQSCNCANLGAAYAQYCGASITDTRPGQVVQAYAQFVGAASVQNTITLEDFTAEILYPNAGTVA